MSYKSKNLIVKDGNDLYKIYLTGENSDNRYAIVDYHDISIVCDYTWSFSKGYARTKIRTASGSRGIVMHRLLMQPLTEEVVDHINGNGLDNRRENLRLCGTSDNNRHITKPRSSNTYVGVRFVPNRNKFLASIVFDKKQIILGLYSEELEAVRIRDAAAKYYFKDFAYINLPNELPVDYDPETFVTPAIKNKSSKYKYVSLEKSTNKWTISLRRYGKNVSRKRFDREEDAYSFVQKYLAGEFNGQYK